MPAVPPAPEPTPTAPDALAPTDRTRLRRHAERGRYDRAEIHAILDEAHVAHVGVVVDGQPRVLPMAYGRVGEVLYLHGAAGNALLRAAAGAEVCVTVTLLDGLVLARSAYHHSMNYRSVVVLGRAEPVVDEGEKRHALEAIVDHAVPGRSTTARPPDAGELRATLVLRLPIEEASAKVRSGGPVDDPGDLGMPVWAGVVPLQLTPGSLVPEPDLPAGVAPPQVARP